VQGFPVLVSRTERAVCLSDAASLADGALGDVEGTADRPQVAVVFGPKLLVDLAKLSLSDVFAHRVSPCGWCIQKDRIGMRLLWLDHFTVAVKRPDGLV